MSEIVNCLLQGKEFITGPNNIVRDYIHPSDLHSLIVKCIEKKKLNCALDVYSLKPASKFEILEEFKSQFGLKYNVESDVKGLNVTGSKDNYYSSYKKAEEIGYYPAHTSLESLVEETRFILSKNKI
jgi:nucleoside-diphosphate-sugar epimerase